MCLARIARGPVGREGALIYFGAAIASFLFGILGISFGGWFGYLIAGLVGACILIAIVRAVRR